MSAYTRYRCVRYFLLLTFHVVCKRRASEIIRFTRPNETQRHTAIKEPLGGIIKAAINTFKQLNENNITPGKSFDWWELLGETAKGAAIGGGAGLVLGAVEDYENSQQNPINTDAFLFAVINDIRLDKNDPEFKWLDNKAHRLPLLRKE